MTTSTTAPAARPLSQATPFRVIGAAVAGVAIAAAAMGPVWGRVAQAAAVARISPHFDAALLAAQPWPVKLHIAAALTALLVGTVILMRPKGGGLHRTLGWLWVTAMGATAVSSLFLRGLNHGAFSLIHLLTGWVLIALPMAIVAIRRRNVRVHQRMMTGLHVGGLIVAGAFTFIPGRLMWSLFLGG